MRDPLNLFQQPEFNYSTLVVGWNSDVGRLGEAVTSFLKNKLNGQLFYEIEPSDYFPLGSVSIEDDMVQFPESKFYYCPQHNLVIFISAQPVFESYQFLTRVLEVARKYYKIKEIYSVGGVASLNTHPVPRQIFGSYNSVEVKNELSAYDIFSDLDYETPVGQKPTLNAYLLWIARRKNLAGADLSVPIPFYFIAVDDFTAQKKVLDFFNRRFQIGLNLSEFDASIDKQNKKLDEIVSVYPEVGDYFIRLERNLHLSEDENVKIVKVIEEYLKSP